MELIMDNTVLLEVEDSQSMSDWNQLSVVPL